jgi:hypothetical protein
MCGDDYAVKALKPKRTDRTPWTSEEMQWLDECIAGEMTLYTLALKTDRKVSAVRSRISRRRQETGAVSKKRPPWEDWEQAFIEEHLDGKYTREEVMELTGRSYQSVRVFACRMRQRRIENENNIERTN